MAIVHMDKRVNEFMEQLSNTFHREYPELQFFDYEEKQDVYKYDEEIWISLPDFAIEFQLVITQTGTYITGDHCTPPSFEANNTEVEIKNLIVFDDVYGDELKFSREEFTEVINKVRNLIVI